MNIQPSSATNIEKAATLIRNAEIVSFPTETVYGLGADATSDTAVAKIFATKGRPSFNPLIVHVDSVEMAQRYVEWTPVASKLAEAFWPGPLTLVLNRKKDSAISLLASAGGDTLGIRMPQHETALALIKASGHPIAAPSANRSGRISPTTAQHVREELGEIIPMILDGGACSVGVESTVLDLTCTPPVLLRLGGVTKDAIEKMQGVSVVTPQEKQALLKSPGLLESHYAPALPVRLNATSVSATEALLAFGNNAPEGAKHVLNLSRRGDTTEAAANLFTCLRMLDKPVYSAIAVMPIPDDGLGPAINDRLKRAAANR